MKLKDGIDAMVKAPLYHPSVKENLDFFLNQAWREDDEIDDEDRDGFESMSLRDWLQFMDDDRHPDIKSDKELWDMEDAYLSELGYDPKKLTGYESPDKLRKMRRIK